MLITQETKTQIKRFKTTYFGLKKELFTFVYLERSFDVFAETKLLKICLILFSKSTFLV